MNVEWETQDNDRYLVIRTSPSIEPAGLGVVGQLKRLCVPPIRFERLDITKYTRLVGGIKHVDEMKC